MAADPAKPLHTSANDKLARLLDEDLTLEFRAIVQTVNHLSTFASTGTDFEQRVTQLHERLEGIMKLALQVSLAGRRPKTLVAPPHLGRSISAAAYEDLALDQILLKRYQNRLQQAESLSLDSMAHAIESRISSLEKTVHFLTRNRPVPQ